MENSFYKNTEHLQLLISHNSTHYPDKKFNYIYQPSLLLEEAEVFEDGFKRLMRKKLKLDLEDQLLHQKAPNLQKLYLDNKERIHAKKPWILITINPKEGTWKEVWKDMFHIKSWIWLKSALITVEQRGEDEQSAGRLVHFHLLLQDYDNEPKKIQKRFFEKFKNFVGNIKHVDIRKVKHEWKKDKVDYLSGNKCDEDKLLKQKMDKVFRRREGLENLYSLDSLPTSESKPRGGARVGAGRKRGRPKKPEVANISISPTNTIIEF